MDTSAVTRFLDAVANGDFSAADEFMHDDLVMEWPQSGERFSSRDNAVAAMSAQTNKPRIESAPRIVGGGDLVVVMMPLGYDEGKYEYVGVFEIEDGRIRRMTEYFGAPFPAQEFRAEFAEPN